MPKEVQQSATIVWTGSVARGSGEVTGGSGALGPLAVDMPTRIGEASGKTTPEELLAAAHVTCFTTALGSILARAKTPPERLEVTSTVTLDMSGERPQIPLVEVRATGNVPGTDDEAFRSAVKEAERACLISRVLTEGTRIEAHGRLD